MNMNKDILKRYTSGEFSFNDYLSVSSCFKEDEYDEGLKAYLEDDWNGPWGTNNDQKTLNQLLDRLHHQINLDHSGKKDSFRSFYHVFSKVAAVLLIPALITIAVLSDLSIKNKHDDGSWTEIYSPVGTRTKFHLPDGTEGWLNSCSSIKYPVNFENRRVEVSGEAWFDVVHLKSRAFFVVTPNFDVKVLGTRFNIIAYDNEATDEVILEKGKVLVLGKDQAVKSELNPDQLFVYNKTTRKSTKTSIESKTYTSWKDGLLIFKNESMAEIARRLERKYNAEIILHGDSLKSSVFRATFQDENLDEICKLLATVAPIQYKIHKRKKQSNDTFTKNKVEMWLKN